MFTKNRDRLLTTKMSRKVMAAILAHREVAPLLSDDHFSGECPIFCVSVIWSMLSERSKDDDDFERTAGRTAEGLQAA